MTARIKDRTTRGRRRRLPAVLTTATAMLLLVGTSAGAATVSQQPQQLPPGFPTVGDEIELPIGLDGLSIPFLVSIDDPAANAVEQLASIGPMEGLVIFEVVAAEQLDPPQLTLQMTEFSLKTVDPAASPAPASAEVDLGLAAIDMVPLGDSYTSGVTQTSQFPPAWEHEVPFGFTMTIENPPQSLGTEAATEQANEPLVLTTKEPGKLIGKLSTFPPKGEIYQLQNPIDLVLPDQPDTVIASIEKFPVQVGGL